MAISDLSSMRNSLDSMASQTYSLATGLQNAAPAQAGNLPTQSVGYLLESSMLLRETSEELTKLVPTTITLRKF